MISRLSGCLFFLSFAAFARAGEFGAPEKITDGARKYQLSRASNSAMAFDSAGRLHVAYWSGRLATTPTSPSFVYHRSYTPGGGWTAQQSIDDSEQAGEHVGGRHPSLAVTPDDDVWIVWHDHRHSTAGGNWIDNIEIYADMMPSGGAFSSTDLRVTTTNAAHFGDNSYTPRIQAHASGRLSIAWYDYTANQNVSDIYLETSVANGVFNFADSIALSRMTNEAARGGSPEYTIPDLAVTPDGTRHLVWCGGQGPGVNLYYAAAADGATSVTEQLLAVNATDFFDPAHITAAPNGDVWIAFADKRITAEDITLLRRRSGEPAFDSPIVLPSPGFRQTAPDIEIDVLGFVHLVWIDERAGTHVFYGVFDPESGQLIEEEQLTDVSAAWLRPTLALGTLGNVFVLFEQSLGLANGDIWFARKLNAAHRWRDYE